MKNIKIVNYENKYSRQNHSELESVKKIKSMAQIHIVYGTW